MNLKNNIYLKLGTIIVLLLLLLIPTNMIQDLIREREATQQEAISEVSSKWAEEQTIAGPILSIPYYRYDKQVSRENGTVQYIKLKDFIYILPEQLYASGNMEPQVRHRGIYEVVVYSSELELKGRFNPIDWSTLDIRPQDILFDQAELLIGIDDLRGVKSQAVVKWNEQKIFFDPGISSNDLVSSGMKAEVLVNPNDKIQYDFHVQLKLRGSQKLYFTPVGKVTDVKMTSPWSRPSFNGSFLPDKTELSEDGFQAHWHLLHLNRNYPQMWLGSKFSIHDSSFGIDLLLPVGNYLKTYRSIRYALLFISFTFLTFFFIEILKKVFIHPIQYILVGVALIVFYTLLLSISEQLNFNWAFLLAAIATLGLIAGYVRAILRSNLLAWLISGILCLLYTFIFVVIQLEDFALLIGSIGLFFILTLVMYISRKIDWYQIKMEK